MSWLAYAVALIAAPLLPGFINKTKAVLAGRSGAPLLQLYSDLWKLARKETVQSRELSPIGRWAPAVLVGSSAAALALMPIVTHALVAFPGDFIALVYLLVLGRLLLVLGALDTGSSFQGMGASRELLISVLAESAFLLGLAVLVLSTRQLTLSGMFTGALPHGGTAALPAIVLAVFVFLLVTLAENARIPFDDPNTHLELTMIHEVMVLDYSGADLALVLYAGALKLLLFCLLLGQLIAPLLGALHVPLAAAVLFATLLIAFAIAAIESLTARIRLLRIAHLLGTATAIAVLALLLTLT